MANEAEAFFEQWEKDQAKVKEMAPNVRRGSGSLFQAVMKEGALSVREKELIALGISVGVQCVACINLHVQKSLRAGATREQVLEAAGVAVMMQGGPAYTFMGRVIDALEYLES